jgi:predicted restriction endonuclease
MCKKEKLTEDFTKTGKQCKDCVCIKNKKYQKENRESINKTNRRYNKERAKVDVNFKLAKLLRTRFYNALKKNHKSGLAIRELGCSIEELKIYLASKFTKGMSWDNHGKWHIDHIKPLSLFDLSNMHELKKAVHYTNLQPLWAEDNYKKNDTYIEEEEICVKN